MVEKIAYGGWPNCYRLANERLELVVTSDVGPRVIRLAFPGERNEFHEFADQVGKTGGDEWRIYGGHRLWHSPEAKPRSYAPDNTPVAVRAEGDTLHVLQPVEALTGLQKEMEITLFAGEARARVTHRLRNTGVWPVTAAAWALSVMAPGGMGIVPHSRRATPDNLLPNRVLTLWPYTDMSDPRYCWGSALIRLRHDPERGPTKIGVSADDGWCAYARDGRLFLKRFAYEDGSEYPDFGCSVEMYTNQEFLELETVGPLRTLAPEGGVLEHVEEWSLYRDVDPADEAALARLAAG